MELRLNHRRRRRLFLVPLVVALLLTLPPARALAYGPYPAGATGVDISYPQCQQGIPAAPATFGIIGVTGGRALWQNPCLIGEYAWALAAAVPPTFFINLNAPSGSVQFKGNSGPRGVCRPDDVICISYNFGYNSARLAYADATSQETAASMWWLDIETENTWSDNTAANDQVVQGAIDFLKSEGRSIGIYSTAQQWSQVAGTFSPGLPVWVAGAPDAGSAPSYCDAAHAFGGGTVWLVQYVVGDLDTDYACGAPLPLTPLTPPPNAPPPPVNPRASALSATSAQIQWTAPASPVTGYVVTDGATQVAQLVGAATSTVLNGLTPGSYHCFAVASLNGPAYSSWSAWACVSLPPG